MKNSRWAAVVVSLVAVVVGMVASGPPAAAETTYVKTNAASYSVYSGEGVKVRNTYCTGRIFIGQTSTNYVNVTNRMSCSRKYAMSTSVSIGLGGPEGFANCSSCYAVTSVKSMKVSSGKKYCAVGDASVWAGISWTAVKTVCLTTL